MPKGFKELFRSKKDTKEQNASHNANDLAANFNVTEQRAMPLDGKLVEKAKNKNKVEVIKSILESNNPNTDTKAKALKDFLTSESLYVPLDTNSPQKAANAILSKNEQEIRSNGSRRKDEQTMTSQFFKDDRAISYTDAIINDPKLSNQQKLDQLRNYFDRR